MFISLKNEGLMNKDDMDTNKYDSKIAQDIESAGNFCQRVDEKLTIIILSLCVISLFGYLLLK